MSSEKLLFDGADLEVGRKEMDRVERRTSVTPETRSGRGHCRSAIFEISSLTAQKNSNNYPKDSVFWVFVFH